MCGYYLSKLTDSQFEKEITGLLTMVNRCHRVYSKGNIVWHFERPNEFFRCVLTGLTSSQLIAFMALFSEVCHFPCFVENHDLVICNF